MRKDTETNLQTTIEIKNFNELNYTCFDERIDIVFVLSHFLHCFNAIDEIICVDDIKIENHS